MKVRINHNLIEQEKTHAVLTLRADAITELLKDCNIAEKYKVLHSLITSLQQIISENKGSIIIHDKEIYFGGSNEL